MLSIAVIGHNRIRCLYVSLRSLFAVRGIENVPVGLYLDGPLDEGQRLLLTDFLAEFPLSRVFFSRNNLGIRGNVLRGIRTEFALGADEVLFLEHDHIVRPDALEYLESCPKDCFFTSLGGTREHKAVNYRAKGNRISRENFAVLDEWIAGLSWVGKALPDRLPLRATDTTHDSVFHQFMIENNQLTRFSAIPYVAHFGILGSNFRSSNAPNEAFELEREMFRRDKECWLEDALAILKRGDWSERLVRRLWPRGFSYGG